jgi:prophage regulatory protein
MNKTLTLLNIKQVTQRVSLSKSSIYRRLDPKEKLYDPSFPRPIKLGENSTRWVETEINIWIKQHIQQCRSTA